MAIKKEPSDLSQHTGHHPLVDVVVVGAGLSGLQAARGIQAAGYSCYVAEATERVGGKTLSVISSTPGRGFNDVGAAWINDTSQSEMYKLFQRYGLDGEIQRAEGASLTQFADGGTVSSPFGELPLDEENSAALLQLLAHLTDLAEKSDLERPAYGPDAEQLDSISIRQYCAGRTSYPAIVNLVNHITRALLGVEGDEVSVLYMINYFKSGTGITKLISDEKDGGQYMRVRQGMQSFSKHLARELEPKSIHLSTPIMSITQNPTTGLCTLKSTTGATFHSRRVIVSIPTALYPSINFTPPLPPTKASLSTNTVLGYYSKMIFVFSHPWWRDANLSGVFDSYVGPISFTRDTSIPSDNQWSITCFIIGEPGRRWSKLSQAARYRAAWNQFRDVFSTALTAGTTTTTTTGGEVTTVAPSDLIPQPISHHEFEWIKQQYFLGAPCPVTPPGVLTSYGDALRSSVGNIHFVGTETSVVWKGYMEGAVRSGIRGADEVVQALIKGGVGEKQHVVG